MFFMVFACLVLSVFATIDEYEETASVILLKMVSKIKHTHFLCYQLPGSNDVDDEDRLEDHSVMKGVKEKIK